MSRNTTADPNNILSLQAQAQFGRLEQAIDDVISTLHAIVDQLSHTLGIDEEEWRRWTCNGFVPVT